MDAFEQVMAGLLSRNGYWVSQGYKVELTKEEKKKVNRPTTPRWELDLVAYSGASEELLVVECKSYIDSVGVRASDIVSGDETNSRYKLFVDSVLRNTVMARLKEQLHGAGFIGEAAELSLGLAVGKFRNASDEAELSSYFEDQGWRLFTPTWMVSQLKEKSEESYFDSVDHIVSKLIYRNLGGSE
ncbi:MAG: hypothetical protein AAGA58_10140 [Verrucomicrobiota bacterium]